MSVSSATLVALVGLITLVDHRPTSISAKVAASACNSAAHSISSRHSLGSIETLLTD